MNKLNKTLLHWIPLAMYPICASAEVQNETPNSFTVTHEVILADTPDAIYDATTGDISGWWDHTFSDKPARVWIEPKPGGRFYELFDNNGDGALHAMVTWAQRGKRLRFVGSLGFSGKPVLFFCTYDYQPDKAGTRLRFTCHVSGVIESEWPSLVDSVWHHFLIDQLKPYIEAGKHKKNSAGDKTQAEHR